MFGLDHLISGLSAGNGLLVVLVAALLLGLRHATDPDHLVAVSTLLATEPDRPARRASALGFSWGLGHATSLLALGLPVVLLDEHVPLRVHDAAEILVGVVIMVLAVRLVHRWRRGRFHAHEHEHEGVPHRHLHLHQAGRHAGHAHEHQAPRSSPQAYAIGLVHGVGGSAAVGVLLLASISSRAEAVGALAVFAFGTAVSMTILSLGVGLALAREPARLRLQSLAPALGLLSFAFGVWYAAAAIQAVA
jgi:ABC-type nickel/cobalt efflux system permease component RcnA